MEKTKKKIKVPHSYVIITCILLLVSILTYVIPAGKYTRSVDEAGKEIIHTDDFNYVEQSGVSPLRIPSLIMQSLSKQSEIIFSLLVIGGAFEVILKTGMFQAYLTRLSKQCGDKGIWLIPLFTLLFGVLGMTQAANKFIAFAPVGVLLATALQLDSIVGVAMVLLGSGIGFSTGILQPTTALAQEIAGLPAYSGIGMRIASFILFYLVTVAYIIRYAKITLKDPSRSLVYGLELSQSGAADDAYVDLKPKHLPILLTVVATFGVIMYGSVQLSWSFQEMAVCFIWMMIIVGAINRNTPSEIAKIFIQGAKGMLGASLVVGLGATVALILSKGNVLDTVVKSSSEVLMLLPRIFRAPGMLLVQVIVNIFVTSGSGQAAIIMPIMSPLADISGITRQTAVLAFKLGDGFCNYILPHATAVMGYLGVTGVPFDRWFKFMWKLFLIWMLLGSAILMFATFTNYS